MGDVMEVDNFGLAFTTLRLLWGEWQLSLIAALQADEGDITKKISEFVGVSR